MKTTIKLGLALAALLTAPAFAHDQHVVIPGRCEASNYGAQLRT